MEYSEDLNVFGEISPIACNTPEKLRDENFIRFIGWQENSDLSEYYSQDTIDLSCEKKKNAQILEEFNNNFKMEYQNKSLSIINLISRFVIRKW